MSAGNKPHESEKKSTWTFLSNHAHVLVCIARNPDARMRDVADQVGITERCALRIVSELEEVGIVARAREGRRNHYELDMDVHLRHPLEDNRTVRDFLSWLLEPDEAKRLGLTPGRRRRASATAADAHPPKSKG